MLKGVCLRGGGGDCAHAEDRVFGDWRGRGVCVLKGVCVLHSSFLCVL